MSTERTCCEQGQAPKDQTVLVLVTLFSLSCFQHRQILTRNQRLFGHDDSFKSDVTFDLILLIGKLFIYKCKIEKTTPKFPTFKIYLKTRHETEKHISNINMTNDKFEMNWMFYNRLVET